MIEFRENLPNSVKQQYLYEEEIFLWINTLSTGWFWDIGSCTGWFGLHAMKQAHNVLFIEPENNNLDKLLYNIQWAIDKGYKGLGIIIPYAIFNKNENKKLTAKKVNSEDSRNHLVIFDEWDGDNSDNRKLVKNYGTDYQKIKCITLQDLPFPCDYMKIDIDGSEWALLENFNKCPKQICIEIHDKYLDRLKTKLPNYEIINIKQINNYELVNVFLKRCG